MHKKRMNWMNEENIDKLMVSSQAEIQYKYEQGIGWGQLDLYNSFLVKDVDRNALLSLNGAKKRLSYSPRVLFIS